MFMFPCLGMTPINRFRVNMFVSATGGLPPDEVTFAELLKTKNYSTAFIGRIYLALCVCAMRKMLNVL